jgi:DNA polymerase-3 subunit gamma/tau
MTENDVYYRKWRPQTLKEVVGQDHVVRTLTTALDQNRVAHAYLFVGPRGTGKTSTARILAKAINCENNQGQAEPCNSCSTCVQISNGSFIDLHEIDAASHRGVEDMRDLISKLPTMPNTARKKVYVIDEVHGLTNYAEEALLKTLEEPPDHVIFILATTEEHSVRATIASRCQKMNFRKIKPQDAIDRLAFISEKENLKIDRDVLNVLVGASEGSLRDASNFLEHLILSAGSNPKVEEAQELFGTFGSDRSLRLIDFMSESKRLPETLNFLQDLYSEGIDMRQLHKELMVEARSILLIKVGVGEILGITQGELEARRILAEKFKIEYLRDLLTSLIDLSIRSGDTPVKLELAFVGLNLASDKSEDFKDIAVETEVIKPIIIESDKNLPNGEPPLPKLEEAVPVKTTDPVQVKSTDSEVTPKDVPQLQTEMNNITIEELKTRWRDIVDSLKGVGASGNLDAFLRSVSIPVSVEDGKITIGFYHDFHKSKIEDPQYKTLVENKLSQVLGRHYYVECMRIERGKEVGHLVQAAVEMGAEVVNDSSNKVVIESEVDNE